MSKRIVVTMTVDDDTDVTELPLVIDGHFGSDADASVWEWADFWADVVDRVVTPDNDTTERHWGESPT